MFVAHLQVVEGTEFSAADMKVICGFVEGWEWESTEAATCAAEDIIPKDSRFVQWGEVDDLVHTPDANGNSLDTGKAKCGVIVNIEMQSPTLFFEVDGSIHLPHLNFDFEDYVTFMFDEEVLHILNLTDVDKTMLRLANNVVKHASRDGTVLERVVK